MNEATGFSINSGKPSKKPKKGNEIRNKALEEKFQQRNEIRNKAIEEELQQRNEIRNKAIEEELQQQSLPQASKSPRRLGLLEFTKQEWDSFELDRVFYNSFIKAGDVYFQPADVEWERLQKDGWLGEGSSALNDEDSEWLDEGSSALKYEEKRTHEKASAPLSLSFALSLSLSLALSLSRARALSLSLSLSICIENFDH